MPLGCLLVGLRAMHSISTPPTRSQRNRLSLSYLGLVLVVQVVLLLLWYVAFLFYILSEVPFQRVATFAPSRFSNH